MQSLPAVNIFWFRRDLRIKDNAGLCHALKDSNSVVPIFIFDRNILDKLDNRTDRRVEFIYQAISALQEELIKTGSTLQVFNDTPIQAFKKLIKQYRVGKVFTNHDYEPYAIERDREVEKLLSENSIGFQTYKDQVIFEKNEVIKDDGTPYTVFTPYSNRWRSVLNDFYLQGYPVEKYVNHFYQQSKVDIPSLSSLGFEAANKTFPAKSTSRELLKHYGKDRDYPGIKGTSRLGVHLRFGTISIRALAQKAQELSDTYLNELIWRDFYHMILWHFPHVGKGKSFRPQYDFIEWRNNEKEFERWCNGTTGYPLVDAGMRELNETGFMHNRVRMVVASFLAKHLLIDWRWGEAYFAGKLLDYDLAANNGGWQWAAGCGCDAAPYFRVFNPTLQAKKFDPELKYIRLWVPEVDSLTYPQPIVDHEFARKRCLEVYSKALKQDALR